MIFLNQLPTLLNSHFKLTVFKTVHTFDCFVMQVSAVALDPSGSRLVTGGYDYEVKFWDFAAMDPSLNSFRSFTPFER